MVIFLKLCDKSEDYESEKSTVLYFEKVFFWFAEDYLVISAMMLAFVVLSWSYLKLLHATLMLGCQLFGKMFSMFTTVVGWFGEGFPSVDMIKLWIWCCRFVWRLEANRETKGLFLLSRISDEVSTKGTVGKSGVWELVSVGSHGFVVLRFVVGLPWTAAPAIEVLCRQW